MKRYEARPIRTIRNRPGEGNSIEVGVFMIDGGRQEQIGSYVRNYASLFRTFFPFSAGGRDFALYSPHYTATRIMELPSCRGIGGEPESGFGFCPVDYYVPCYGDRETRLPDGRVMRYRIHESDDDEWASRWAKEGESTTPTYYPFGFVAGCVWGDDSSWKIHFLDLSEVLHGKLKRDDRFGYIELPENLSLKQAIDLSGFEDEPEQRTVTIAVRKAFDLTTGKPLKDES